MCVCMYFLLQSAWMFLETVATFASSLVDEVAVIGFWQQCVGQRDDTSSTGTHLTVHMYVCCILYT